MFKGLLFTWVIITVVLVMLLLWYLVSWIKSVFVKQKVAQQNTDDQQESSDEEYEQTDTFYDSKSGQSRAHSTIDDIYRTEDDVEIDVDNDDEVVIENILVIEEEPSVLIVEIEDEQTEFSQNDNNINESDNNVSAYEQQLADEAEHERGVDETLMSQNEFETFIENTSEAKTAEEADIDARQEEAATNDDEVQQEKQVAPSNTHDIPMPKKTPTVSSYTGSNPVIPEIPKDYDASRNIAQGHSRDDIIRDKFDKHLQKIRYEAGILKQRSDMLGYEKKLVEGLTLLPTDKDFQKQLADLYFHQGKYKKSQSLLKKILLDTPDDHYALWQVGEIALTEGHNEDAFVHFQQAYTNCEDNPKYCFSLAQRYYDAGDLEQALPLMEKMVKLRPKSIEYLVSLSHVQHKMGLRENAKQSLMRALELDPMNITIKQYLKSL